MESPGGLKHFQAGSAPERQPRSGRSGASTASRAGGRLQEEGRALRRRGGGTWPQAGGGAAGSGVKGLLCKIPASSRAPRCQARSFPGHCSWTGTCCHLRSAISTWWGGGRRKMPPGNLEVHNSFWLHLQGKLHWLHFQAARGARRPAPPPHTHTPGFHGRRLPKSATPLSLLPLFPRSDPSQVVAWRGQQKT